MVHLAAIQQRHCFWVRNSAAFDFIRKLEIVLSQYILLQEDFSKPTEVMAFLPLAIADRRQSASKTYLVISYPFLPPLFNLRELF